MCFGIPRSRAIQNYFQNKKCVPWIMTKSVFEEEKLFLVVFGQKGLFPQITVYFNIHIDLHIDDIVFIWRCVLKSLDPQLSKTGQNKLLFSVSKLKVDLKNGNFKFVLLTKFFFFSDWSTYFAFKDCSEVFWYSAFQKRFQKKLLFSVS